MRIALFSGILCAGVFAVSCKERNYGEGDVKAQKFEVVNPMAFNAFLLWRDGKSEAILDYPAGFGSKGKKPPDAIFYVDESEYLRGESFIAVPTVGAAVSNDVLTYQSKNNRQLALKFEMLAGDKMVHAKAVEECKKKQMRLPTLREAFDYCVAGTERLPNGSFKDHRCGKEPLWTASLFAENNQYVWLFYVRHGYVGRAGYDNTSAVVCVGQL
jgi:hypothetical protein